MMKAKHTLLVIALLVANFAIAQDYIMGTDTGTITTTSGTFYDSGGPGSLYSSNENYEITFCPDLAVNPGSVIKLEFTAFNTQGTDGGTCNDPLTIYHGNSVGTAVTSEERCGDLGALLPFSVQSLDVDNGGCITFTFSSDNTSQKIGWAATITNYVPCTPPVAALVDDSPVNLVPGDDFNVSVDASPSTTVAGTSIATYQWSWGDGTTSETTVPTASHLYDSTTPGIYQMSLVVRSDDTSDDPEGCRSPPQVKSIRVIPTPDFSGTEATVGTNIVTNLDVNCGATVDLTGLVVSQTITTSPPILDSGITQLPDGSGQVYSSNLDFSGYFTPGETITPGCYPTLFFDIEHSYTGDLDIELIAPNGVSVLVFDQTGGGNHFGYCTNAADDGVAGCVAPYSVADSGGVAWTSAEATIPSTDADIGPCTDFAGPCQSGTYFKSQLFNSANPFSAFDGAPMNGVWQLRITDNLGIDDGVLSRWYLDFPLACYGTLETVTPDLVDDSASSAISGMWTASGGPTLPIQAPTFTTVVNPDPADCPSGETCEGTEVSNDISVGPFGPDDVNETYTYTFTVVDEFGGVYEELITITVSDNCNLELISDVGTDAQTICQDDSIINIVYEADVAVTNITVTGLPAGITGTYDPVTNTFTITGTAPFSAYNYTVYAYGADGTELATKTGTITITETPTATISYAGTPFCDTITTAEAVTLTGTAAYTGGTYSSTAGLDINATTGAITPSTSTAGTYTVTYTIPASASCPAIDVTTDIVITENPTATISYAGTPFCDTITTAETVDLTGTAAYTGGTYSSTVGLDIDATTGAITPSTSTAGTYTVTYTIPAGAGCLAIDVTTDVTITALPTVAISYVGTPYCSSIATAEAVDLSGTGAYTGGVYSSTAGLDIDAATGAITPSTSTAGTYTVTYTTLASGGCSAISTTTDIVITENPTATISYAGTPFCDTITTAETVTITGTGAYTGGTYSSTVGLDIDATTGAITPSTSTAGTYTVTYTIPAGAGCLAIDVTTDVTITALPTVAISYVGTPYCSSIATAEAVDLSGTGAYTGGVYSSTAGLDIDAATGAITPSTSTAGTYTVTYTTLASGGCSAISTTTDIVITENPTATISYVGTPFCDTITTAETVTITGTGAYTGGTYSSTVGLDIDATTGSITPSTSTAGTYTVTYTIPAGAGCLAIDVTTDVTITALPTVAISYVGTPYCSSITTAEAVDLTGTGAYTGGVYSSTAGLDIDAATGAITPSTSTAGTYTVTYTTLSSAGCSAISTTTDIVITENPTATISYAGTPFCITETADMAVSLTGTGTYTGGVYSSTTGLDIDATTGAITPSTSTAGTYTVTYTIPAGAGCLAIDVTTDVTITALPTAAISYVGTPYCSSITTAEAVDLTGTGAYTGGVYSSTAGLDIDAATGAITPSTSTAGTYTVTYTTLSSGGCSAISTTTDVVITDISTAVIAYIGAPFCITETADMAVSLTGTGTYTGGVYSSTTGLDIDATTGAITPSTSIVGIYTVTYTTLASGGCAAVPSTTIVEIIAVPTATISYDTAPFCLSTETEEDVTLIGTGAYIGGVYSGTAGLFIDSVTGAITPSLSTVGVHTITYTTPTGEICTEISTTADITIHNAPTANVVSPLYACDEDNDGFNVFDLANSATLAEITGGSTSYTVTFHETLAEAESGVGAIDTTVSYANINDFLQIIYVRVELASTGCFATIALELHVINSPILPLEDIVYSVCDDYEDLTDGLVLYDLTAFNAAVLANIDPTTTISDYTVAYYTALDVDGNPDPATLIANPTAFQNTVVPDQVIYISVTRNDSTACESVRSVTLHVDLLPNAVYSAIHTCDDDTADGFVSFNLIDEIPTILDGATGLEVNFYTVQEDAIAGTGASLITNPEDFTNTANPQAIFAHVLNPLSGCDTVSIIVLHVDPNPTPLSTLDIAATLGVMMACDGNVDGSGAIGEQIADFDLTQWEVAILTGDGPGIEVGVSAAYYTSYDEAVTTTNPIIDPTDFQNTSNPQTIFVRVTNDVTGCYTIVSFDIFVPVPNVSITGDTILCVDQYGVPLPDSTLPVLTAVAGPPPADAYNYQWALNDVIIPGETGQTITVSQAGIYTVTVAGPLDMSCINMASHTVTLSGSPSDFNANVTTNAFADMHQIVASATSSTAGIVFWYSLDGGTPNTSGVFNDVSVGSHTITITDAEGCWSETITVMVIDYPKFFTPNNDGHNDTWQIVGISDIAIAQIYIFDRYGKLLKQLDPNGAGWDGTFNGAKLPATDYWFKIIYLEGNPTVEKEFRAHFSLKR